MAKLKLKKAPEPPSEPKPRNFKEDLSVDEDFEEISNFDGDDEDWKDEDWED